MAAQLPLKHACNYFAQVNTPYERELINSQHLQDAKLSRYCL
jgi:hypothetical protein